MAYASIDDLRDFLPRYKIDDTTQPNAVQATGYLSLVSTTMDSVLAARGYDVPIIGVESLILLKNINLLGAAYWTTRIMFPSATNGMVTELRDEYGMLMKMLVDGQIQLPDATTSPDNEALFSDIDSPDPYCDRVTTTSTWNGGYDVYTPNGNAPFITRREQF